MIGGSRPAEVLENILPWENLAPDIAAGERSARLASARSATAAAGSDALLVVAGASLRYFTGVTWTPSERLTAMLLPVYGDPVIVCPAFEVGTLRAELAIDADIRLWQEDEDPIALIAEALTAMGVNRLSVDPLLPFGWAERLRDRAGCPGLQDGSSIIDGCRMIKSAAELALMQQAKSMTLEVHRLTASILHAGIRASEVIRFVDAAHRALGARGSSFCLVQFGQATAFPHGLPGDQILEHDQLVLIDTGCLVHGYHSDITRTYGFGEVGPQVREIWHVEKAAQRAAFQAVRPGRTCASIDDAARAVLQSAGLGPDYRLPGLPHRTGHGIGLSIHEPAYLVRGDETVLVPGMCFSNEPMIVVPDRFGIRLEDHFHVTETGAKWFTEPQVSIDAPFG